MPRFREETLNVTLARLLEGRGLAAVPETVVRHGLPDVMVRLDGLRLVIEGRRANQKASLIRDARARVTSGIADLSLAVLYPVPLYTANSLAELETAMDAAHFDGAIFLPGSAGPTHHDIVAAQLDGLAEIIRASVQRRIDDDVVRVQVDQTEEAIKMAVDKASVTNLFSASDALQERLGRILGL